MVGSGAGQERARGAVAFRHCGTGPRIRGGAVLAQLPVISGREARRAFERAGWIFERHRSSHMILTKPGVPANLSVPDHRELDRGTLRALIRASDLTVEQFIELL